MVSTTASTSLSFSLSVLKDKSFRSWFNLSKLSPSTVTSVSFKTFLNSKIFPKRSCSGSSTASIALYPDSSMMTSTTFFNGILFNCSLIEKIIWWKAFKAVYPTPLAWKVGIASYKEHSCSLACRCSFSKIDVPIFLFGSFTILEKEKSSSGWIIIRK